MLPTEIISKINALAAQLKEKEVALGKKPGADEIDGYVRSVKELLNDQGTINGELNTLAAFILDALDSVDQVVKFRPSLICEYLTGLKPYHSLKQHLFACMDSILAERFLKDLELSLDDLSALGFGLQKATVSSSNLAFTWAYEASGQLVSKSPEAAVLVGHELIGESIIGERCSKELRDIHLNAHKDIERELSSVVVKIKSTTPNSVESTDVDSLAAAFTEVTTKVEAALNSAAPASKKADFSTTRDIRAIPAALVSIEPATFTRLPVSKYLAPENKVRWAYLRGEDFLKGQFSALVPILFPYYITTSALRSRAEALAQVLADEALLHSIIQPLINNYCIKGRTLYNKNKTILLSQLLVEIVGKLTRIPAKLQGLVALPLIGLTVAEFAKTGLLEADIEFTIAFPVPIDIPSNGFTAINLIMQEEIKKMFMMYEQRIAALNFSSDAVVAAGHIVSSVINKRHFFVADLNQIERAEFMFQRLIPLLTACALQLPTPLLLNHPNLINEPVIRSALELFELVKISTYNEDPAYGPIASESILEVIKNQVTWEEVQDTLAWFAARISALAAFAKPLKDHASEFMIKGTKFSDGRFHSALAYKKRDTTHEVSVLRATKFKATNSFVLMYKDRISLTEKMNSLASTISGTIGSDKFFDMIGEYFDAGELPAFLLHTNASADELEKLAIAHQGMLILGHANLAVALKKLPTITRKTSDTIKDISDLSMADLSDVTTELLGTVSMAPIPVFEVETAGMSLGDVSFINPVLYLKNASDFIWANTLLKGIDYLPSKVEPSADFSLPVIDGVTRVNFVNDPDFVGLNRDYEFDFAVLGKKIRTRLSLAVSYARYPVSGSQMFITRRGTEESTSRLAFLLSLEAMTYGHRKAYNANLNQSAWEASRAARFLEFIGQQSADFIFLVSRLVHKVGTELQPVINGTMPDLNLVTRRQVTNECGVQILMALNDLLELIDANMLKMMIDRARSSVEWSDRELFKIAY